MENSIRKGGKKGRVEEWEMGRGRLWAVVGMRTFCSWVFRAERRFPSIPIPIPISISISISVSVSVSVSVGFYRRAWHGWMGRSPLEIAEGGRDLPLPRTSGYVGWEMGDDAATDWLGDLLWTNRQK